MVARGGRSSWLFLHDGLRGGGRSSLRFEPNIDLIDLPHQKTSASGAQPFLSPSLVDNWVLAYLNHFQPVPILSEGTIIGSSCWSSVPVTSSPQISPKQPTRLQRTSHVANLQAPPRLGIRVYPGSADTYKHRSKSVST